VLLASYGAPPTAGRKGTWLAARAPERRRDPQVLTVGLTQLVGSYYAHCWDSARWLWDRRAAGVAEVARWGVEGLDLGRLGSAGRAGPLADFERRRAAPAASAADRAALGILLQDEGRLETACALHGVELAPSARDLLRGRWIAFNALRIGAAWTEALQQALRTAALWRLAPLIADLAARRQATATGRRRPRPVRLRLFALPHQPHVSKTSVMLVGAGDAGSTPRIELEDTAWDDRLPEVLWRRPLELDLRRFGLL
jgi:hypothetical protein